MSASQIPTYEDTQALIPRKAFRPVEEIHSAAIELTKDIGGMGSQKFADAIMTFSDNVVSENSETRNTVGLLRETVESQQQQIDQMQIQINKSAQEIQVLVRWCKSLVGDVTLLKDIALGYRPAQTALAIRRELNDGRCAVYEGFALLFGAHLGSEKDISLFDSRNSTVEWSRFLGALDRLFQSHFVGGVQRKSVFANARLSSIMTINQALQPIDPQPAPFHNFGGARFDISNDPEDDRFIIQRLEFFLPVVIWAYIELKKAILHDEDVICAMQQEANQNQTVLNKFTGINEPVPFPSVLDRVDVDTTLQVGTAFEFRKDSVHWKNSYTRFKRRSPPSQPMALDEDPSTSGGRAASSSSGSAPHKRSSSNDDNANTTLGRHLMVVAGGSDMYRLVQSVLKGRNHGAGQENEVVSSALSKILAANKGIIETAEKRKAENEAYFITIFKCLSVLTDKELFKLALLPSSYLRKVMDDFIVKPNNYDEMVADVLGRYAEVVDESKSHVMNTVEHGVDLADEGLKLTKYLYQTEQYLRSGALHVERAVDKILIEAEDQFDHDSDIAVLLTWLEALLPAVVLDSAANN